MADLKSLIKQNGLKKTSQEELTTLSNKAGLQANPLSPLSAGGIGANPDQAKMAGSSASKAVSLQDSAGGDLSLRDTLRREQQSTQMTDEEKQKAANAQTLTQFTGKLDERVQAIAMQKLGGAGQPTQSLQPKINPEKLTALFPGIAPEKSAEMSEAIGKLMTSPSDLESARKVAVAMGMDPNSMSADQLINQVSGVLEKEKDQLAGMADNIEDSVTVQDLFGTPEATEAFGDPSLIANALGMQLEQFMGADMNAIKAKMEEIGLDSFSDIADLQRRLNDPYTAPGERSAIQRELQRLGAAGVRATENDVAKLEEEINSANTVEIGGNAYTTEELLKDDTINALIADYLEDPEAKEALAGTDLAKFIERNRAALSNATANLSGNARALADVQQKNRELAKTKNGTSISDNVMKALFPEWGTLATSAFDPTKSKAYQNFTSMSPNAQDSVSVALSGVKDPSLIEGVLNADPVTLENLAQSGGLTTWLSFRQLHDSAESMAPENAVSALLGRDPSQFSQTLKDFRNAQAAGLIDNYSFPFADVLDANNDGILDDAKTLKAALLTYTDSLANNLPRTMKDTDTPAGQIGGLGNFLPNTKSVYERLKGYIGDGAFDTNDANDIISKGGSDRDLRDIHASGVGSNSAREAISNELTNRSFKKIAADVTALHPWPTDPFDLTGISNTAKLQRAKFESLTQSPDIFEAAAARKQIAILDQLYPNAKAVPDVAPAAARPAGSGQTTSKPKPTPVQVNTR